MEKQETFKGEVRRAVLLAIARLPGGTVGVSADCLWQLTRIPHTCAGPVGTNAGWVARQVFNDVIKERCFQRIIMEEARR